MAISRLKTWVDGEVLTAGDLNSEFNNVVQAGISLVSPLASGETFDLDGKSLILDTDGDTSMIASTDDLLELTMEGVLGFQWDGRTNSAVNGIIQAMTATGVAPTIGPRSTADVNVDFNLVPMGTGQIQFDGVDTQNVGNLHHAIRYYGS